MGCPDCTGPGTLLWQSPHRPLLLLVSDWTVCARLYALARAWVDSILGAPDLLSHFPIEQPLAEWGALFGTDCKSDRLAGLPLPACVQPAPAAANQVGRLRDRTGVWEFRQRVNSAGDCCASAFLLYD